MNDRDLPPLDDEVRLLIARTREIEPAPAFAKAHALARVALVVRPPGGGNCGGSRVDTGGSTPARAGLAGRLLPLSTAFAFGTIVGAVAIHTLAHRPPPETRERIVYVERPGPVAPSVAISVAPSVAVSVAPASPPNAASPTPFLAASSGSARAVSASGASGSFAAERVLLDGARSAIEREDGVAALAAINEHERRFRDGFLVQEREAMAVRALSLLGRADEAHARATRFRARFPDSFLLPALESQSR